MKTAIYCSLALGLVTHSTSALSTTDEEIFRLCSLVGNTAEEVLTLRYAGADQAKASAELNSIKEPFQKLMRLPLDAMIKEAYARPYHRKPGAQLAEAEDFGEVYYKGCLARYGL